MVHGSTDKIYVIFCLFFGTGIPGVIVLISASSAHEGYGTDSR